MKKLLTYMFMLFYSYSFCQESLTVSQALNISSKQSMLCERLAKEKVFNATHPNNYNVEKKLIVSLIQFERNISILKGFELPEKVSTNLNRTETLWTSYRNSLLSKDPKSTLATIEHSKNMYFLCETIFSDLLSLAKTDKLYPYNFDENFSKAYIASNEIKNLSQKFSLSYNTYYSKALKHNVDFNAIISAIDSYVVNINKVKNINSDINNKTIEIEKEWNELKSDTKETVENDFAITEKDIKPEEVLIKTNKLLRDADLLTRLYKEYNDIN